MSDPLLDRARAWLAVAEGRPAEARAELEVGIALAQERGEWPYALMMLHDLARLGDPDPARAASLADRGIGCMGTARIHHITGLGTGDLDRLGSIASIPLVEVRR